MRKVITILLTFIMLLSSATLAESADQYYYGSWFFAREMKGPYYCFTLFHLFEDGSAYYYSNIIDSGKIDDDPVELLTKWESSDEGIRIFFNAGYQQYYLLEDGRLSDGESFAPAIFTKVFPDIDVNIPNSGRGITVPSGVYVAGEDFPAGTYRVELADPNNGGVFLLYDSISDVNTAFAYLYEYRISKYDSPVVGKIEIKAGNALAVRNTVIVLLPYEGLQ